MVKFSIGDRKIEVLRRPVGNTTGKISPDGKYVAFVTQERDAFHSYVLSLADNSIVQVDSGAHTSDIVWSPDGSHVVVNSDRAGRWDLWAVPIHDGKPTNEGRMVYANSSQIDFNGWRDPSSLVFHREFPQTEFYAIRMDGSSISAPKAIVPVLFQQQIETIWSSDGSKIAIRVPAYNANLAIYDLKTQELRQVRTDGLAWFDFAGWPAAYEAPLVKDQLEDGRADVFRTSTNAAPSRLNIPEMSRGMARVSRDGSTVVFLPWNPATHERQTKMFEVYDLKHQRRLRNINLPSGHGAWEAAPDGSALVYAADLGDHSHMRIMRLTLSSGESKTIVDNLPGIVRGLAIAPDGRIAFCLDQREDHHAPRQLFVIPAGGGEPQSVQIPATHKPMFLTFSPDGKQLGYVSDEWRTEFVALSNFLPQPQQNGQ